jgi:transposase
MPKLTPGQRRAERSRARRVEAARLFEAGATQAEVARRLDVSRVTALRMYRTWRKGGREAMSQSRVMGRPVRLTSAQLGAVERVLLDGPLAAGYSTDLWTLPRMSAVIERQTGVRYHPGHVWRVVRQLGWSLQRPAQRARERDEEAIAGWRKRRWPRVKKTPTP